MTFPLIKAWGCCLLVAWLLFSPLVQAAVTDFTADGNITVAGVTFDLGAATADLLIFNGSTAESWNFNNGVFTVTNPSSSFRVGSSDRAVKTIIAVVTADSSIVGCVENTEPGAIFITPPLEAGTYTIRPSGNTGCTRSVVPVFFVNPSLTTNQFSDYQPIAKTPATITQPIGERGAIDQTLLAARSEAATIVQAAKETILAEIGKTPDKAAEVRFEQTIVKQVVAGLKVISSEVKEKIIIFVTYGTPTTDKLGAGERGGVVNSFKEAFGKAPSTQADWEDVVKIANGRWPSQTSNVREKGAERRFRTIYKRAPDRANAKDDAAVVVMAYGLRPAKRNLASERAAIKTYKAVFGHVPTTATAWDAVRATAYSGAIR